jgi:hypothetical protein
MLILALEIGLTVQEFWDMTPREFSFAVEAENRRRKAQNHRDAWLVWHTEALRRTKKMPSLKKLAGEAETKVLTDEEKAQLQREHEEMVKRMTKRG